MAWGAGLVGFLFFLPSGPRFAKILENTDPFLLGGCLWRSLCMLLKKKKKLPLNKPNRTPEKLPSAAPGFFGTTVMPVRFQESKLLGFRGLKDDSELSNSGVIRD